MKSLAMLKPAPPWQSESLLGTKPDQHDGSERDDHVDAECVNGGAVVALSWSQA